MLSRVREEATQGQTEYALLLALMGLALVFMLLYFGGWLGDLYRWVVNQLLLQGQPMATELTCPTLYKAASRTSYTPC